MKRETRRGKYRPRVLSSRLSLLSSLLSLASAGLAESGRRRHSRAARAVRGVSCAKTRVSRSPVSLSVSRQASKQDLGARPGGMRCDPWLPAWLGSRVPETTRAFLLFLPSLGARASEEREESARSAVAFSTLRERKEYETRCNALPFLFLLLRFFIPEDFRMENFFSTTKRKGRLRFGDTIRSLQYRVILYCAGFCYRHDPFVPQSHV